MTVSATKIGGSANHVGGNISSLAEFTPPFWREFMVKYLYSFLKEVYLNNNKFFIFAKRAGFNSHKQSSISEKIDLCHPLDSLPDGRQA